MFVLQVLSYHATCSKTEVDKFKVTGYFTIVMVPFTQPASSDLTNSMLHRVAFVETDECGIYFIKASGLRQPCESIVLLNDIHRVTILVLKSTGRETQRMLKH